MYAHAAELPALQWKILNLQKLKAHKRPEFEAQASELKAKLD